MLCKYKLYRNFYHFGHKNDCFKVLNVHHANEIHRILKTHNQQYLFKKGLFLGSKLKMLRYMQETHNRTNVFIATLVWINLGPKMTFFGSWMWIFCSESSHVFTGDSKLAIFIHCHSYSRLLVTWNSRNHKILMISGNIDDFGPKMSFIWGPICEFF